MLLSPGFKLSRTLFPWNKTAELSARRFLGGTQVSAFHVGSGPTRRLRFPATPRAALTLFLVLVGFNWDSIHLFGGSLKHLAFPMQGLVPEQGLWQLFSLYFRTRNILAAVVSSGDFAERISCSVRACVRPYICLCPHTSIMQCRFSVSFYPKGTKKETNPKYLP